MNTPSSIPWIKISTNAPKAWRGHLERLGFQPSGATSVNGTQTEIMVRGTARMLVSVPAADSTAAADLAVHGDGFADVCLDVADVAAAFDLACAAGAAPIQEPAASPFYPDLPLAVVGGPGTFRHTLRQAPAAATADGQLPGIDHIALAVPAAELDATVAFYEKAFGFVYERTEQVVIGDQGLDSGVLYGGGPGVTITVVSPDPGRQPGQIDDFIAANHGPGIQHVAFAVPDITSEVREAAAAGLAFLPTPGSYYDDLPGRIGFTPPDLNDLRATSVLLDVDPDGGELRQIFTSTVADCPAFFELITRRGGASGFGLRNIEYLFRAKQRAS